MSKPDSVIDELFCAVFKVLLTIIGGLLLCQAIVNAVVHSLGEPTFTLLVVLGSICAYLYIQRGRRRASTSRSNLVFERQRIDAVQPTDEDPGSAGAAENAETEVD